MKAYKERSGFFKTPHALIDTWGQILGPYVYTVYSCIASHASYKSQSAFPSYATIAQKCGMNPSTAISAVADLVFLGFIKKVAVWHPDGDQDSNTYHLLDVPKIEDVMHNLLDDPTVAENIPKKHQWIIENLKAYSAEKFKKREYDNVVKARNTRLNTDGVIVLDNNRSCSEQEPVLVLDNNGYCFGQYKIETPKEKQIKETHLHTAKNENESQATSLDSTEKGVASDKPIEAGNGSEVETLIWGSLLMGDAVSTEKMLIKSELMKLSDTKLAQHVLDEVLTKYAAGKVKTSLAVYTKGLVNKANKGEFAPTNNLQLKRAEKAQKATIAKSNTPVAERTFTRSSELIAGLKQTIAAGGGRAFKKTPEEQAEINKALAEIAARRK